MTITATEFKTNFGKYLDIVLQEDIFITKNGKVIAQLSKPQFDRMAVLHSLVGIADNGNDASLDDIKLERLTRQ